jgi:membrane-bound ClpP family serine protease
MLVFLALAALGLLLLLVSAFGGHDTEFHADIDHAGFGFLSVRAFAVFFLAFGVVGGIGRYYGRGVLVSSLLGLLAGALMVAVYLGAMNVVKSQQASSLIGDADLVGHPARVLVAIPADGFGEVQCTAKAQTTRRMARSKSHTAIAENEIVRIEQMQGDVAIVAPVAD